MYELVPVRQIIGLIVHCVFITTHYRLAYLSIADWRVVVGCAKIYPQIKNDYCWIMNTDKYSPCKLVFVFTSWLHYTITKLSVHWSLIKLNTNHEKICPRNSNVVLSFKNGKESKYKTSLYAQKKKVIQYMDIISKEKSIQKKTKLGIFSNKIIR